MKAKILWIQGKRASSPSFVSIARKRDYVVDVAPNGSEGIARLEGFDPDLVIVNAASMRSSGKRICADFRNSLDGMPILLIANPDSIIAEDDTCANTVLIPPFSQRKLTNRINQLLPGEGKLLLHVGPMRLDLERRRVRCHGRETLLTPRLTELLHLFMKRPGEVLEREMIFSQIWQTDYTEDTRSLDVHISWLREAIEENPRKPQHLKTIRGVGYRLDV